MNFGHNFAPHLLFASPYSLMKKILLPLLMGLSMALSGQKYSIEFLSIGVGARALGMGNASVANVSDVTAGYWNPAGLTELKSWQASFMHAEWFGNIANYDYAALARPIGDQNRVLGLSFIRFGIDNIPNTLSLYQNGVVNYDNVTPFSAADYAGLISYAQKTKLEGLSLGGNAKIVHHKIGRFASAWGFGLDLGAQYTRGDWRFGAVARDLTSTFNAWRFQFTEEEKQVLQLTDNEIPRNSLELTLPRLVLGASWSHRWTVNKKKAQAGARPKELSLLAEVDLTLTTDGERNVLIRTRPLSIDPVLGAEIGYDRLVFVRLGLNNLQQVTQFDGQKNWTVQPTFGIGLNIWKFRVDYALGNVGSSTGLQYSHILSLVADLDFIKW
jgi:hypothetical protein